MASITGVHHRVNKLSEVRRKKIRTRLKDYSLAEIVEAIRLIHERPYLMGQNDKGWVANFNWLLKPDRIGNILEGGMYMETGRKSGCSNR